MRTALVATLLTCLLATSTFADIYQQYPPGSNDRLNEQSADRQNAQRLFNSQNNARGGYCYGGSLNYYAGSIVPIEWTNQHSCGSSKAQCQVVIQYMCGYNDGPEEERIRDGTTTATINDDPATFNAKNANGDFVSGMHESYAYYQLCKERARNKGLFTSNQNLNTNDARATRQSNGATRYGFECSEERDYYPYWAASPWKDIVVYTEDDKKMCPYFQKESLNVKSRFSCSGSKQTPQPIDEGTCKSNGGSWTEQQPWGIPEPDCLPAPWNRDNHLGNGAIGGATNSFNWTVPTQKTESCVIGDKCVCTIRIRYNITTAEIDGYGMYDGAFTDYTANAKPPISTDPSITVAGNNFTLAVNTAQFGRTFQDRTHTFAIKNRPNNIPADAKIFNLGVRGKRGNIVQTFPATEYDFVPETVVAQAGDYIHFQWTGCDNNPQNNDGEGFDGSDRSNIAQIPDVWANLPYSDDDLNGGKINALFKDRNTRQLMSNLGQTGCLSYAELLEKHGNNNGNIEDDRQNCMKLNAAPTPHFDGGLVKMTSEGTFHYMSTRNNNFSNRSQKGTIIILPLVPAWGVALIVIGAVAVAAAGTATGGYVYSKKHPHGRVANAFNSVSEKFSNLGQRLRRG